MSTVVITLNATVMSFLVLLVTACTSASNVKPYSETQFSRDPNIETQAKLNQQSADLHKELKRRGLLYRDKEANQYINQIGQSLAPDFLQGNNPVHFYIIKNATANAMALPNGNIYINIGLLSVVENEDQLAAILAHEISHVVQRHSLKTTLNMQDTILSANIADIFLLGTGLSYASAMGSLAEFNREQEKEADLVSLAYLYKAGYDLNQAPAVFKLFQDLPESMTTKDSIYSSHPDNMERVNYLEDIVKDSYTGQLKKPGKPDVFNRTRAKIVESNVQIRLRSHQYKLALYTLERAEDYYKKAPLIQYYRGEAYRLMAKNPKKAYEEAEWLAEETEQDLDYFRNNQQAHYKKAESFYKEALNMQSDLAQSYKGLGLIYYSNKRYEQAIQHFDTYLEMSEKPVDHRYIKRLIRNSKRKLGDKS